MGPPPSPADVPRQHQSRVSRRPARLDYLRRRLRTNWVLKGSAVLSFLCYGGLGALALAGRMPYQLGTTIAFMSLATWCVLLWWFPILDDTIRATRSMPGRAWIGQALELMAVGCVAVVHLLMAAMIVIRARS